MADGANAIQGMSRVNGEQIAIEAHIQQSINDILLTPIGSRVMRREYGSYFFALIDSAMNAQGRLRLTAALVDAINKWEPRVELTAAEINVSADGKTQLDYTYKIITSDNTSANTISGVAVLAG